MTPLDLGTPWPPHIQKALTATGRVGNYAMQLLLMFMTFVRPRSRIDTKCW